MVGTDNSMAIAELIAVLRADSTQFDAAMAKADSSMRNAGSNASGLERHFKTLALGIGGASAAIGALAVTFVSKWATIGVQTSAMLESVTLQFATLQHSTDLAKQTVADLFEFAKKTPYETGPIIQASKMLQTFGMVGKEAKAGLTLIGDSAAATQTNIQELGFWVGRAYSMIKGGRPFGEAAMRLQELAVMSPQARQEMEKMTARGEDWRKVWAVMEKDLLRFNGAMLKQSETWAGLSSTLSDSFTLTAAEIFEPLFRFLKSIMQSVVDLTSSDAWKVFTEAANKAVTRIIAMLKPLQELKDKAFNPKNLTGFLAKIAKISEKFSSLLPLIIGVSGGLAGAFLKSLPFINKFIPMAVNPLISGLLGIGVAALVGTKQGRTALVELGKTAKATLAAILPALGVLGNALSQALLELLPTITKLVNSLAKAAVPAIQTLATSLIVLVPVIGAVGKILNVVIGIFTPFIQMLASSKPLITVLTTVLALHVAKQKLFGTGVAGNIGLLGNMSKSFNQIGSSTIGTVSGLSRVTTSLFTLKTAALVALAVVMNLSLSMSRLKAEASSWAEKKFPEIGGDKKNSFSNLLNREREIITSQGKIAEKQTDFWGDSFVDKQLGPHRVIKGWATQALGGSNEIQEMAEKQKQLDKLWAENEKKKKVYVTNTKKIDATLKKNLVESPLTKHGPIHDMSVKAFAEIGVLADKLGINLAATGKKGEAAVKSFVKGYLEMATATGTSSADMAENALLVAQKWTELKNAGGESAEGVRKAFQAAADSVKTLGGMGKDLKPENITEFYTRVTADANSFMSNIKLAMKNKLSPAYIAKLITAGPAEAASLVQTLVSDNTGQLIKIVNEGELALTAIQTKALELNRLTNIAVTGQSQELTSNVTDAMTVAMAVVDSKGTATLESLVTSTGLTSDRIKLLVGQFGLDVVGLIPPTLFLSVDFNSQEAIDKVQWFATQLEGDWTLITARMEEAASALNLPVMTVFAIMQQTAADGSAATAAEIAAKFGMAEVDVQKVLDQINIALGKQFVTPTQPEIKALDKTAAGITSAKEAINRFRDNYKNIEVEIKIVGSETILDDGKNHKKAMGGPVLRNSMYLVGENGPELFKSSVPGKIIPNSLVPSTLTNSSAQQAPVSVSSGVSANGSANTYSVTVNVPVGGDMATAGREMVDAIAAYERRNGIGWRN